MSLAFSYNRVIGSLRRRRNQADNILDDLTGDKLTTWELRFLSESLLANIWLDWNAFVKDVLIKSCAGSITRSNQAVLARSVPDNSESRICYEVKQYSSGSLATLGKVYSGPLEPTWANPDKIISCVNGLLPNNSQNLMSAFGAGNLVGSKRIHQVRNASAHKSRQNRVLAATLRSSYRIHRYLDPIDIIWGTNGNTHAIAIYEWIDDLETIADLATQ